ncbi:MAG: nucleotidyl transferase AbiEii/AbiGii toxin family protein [Nitrospira sp.]|nr:nucleotidyl transferase AbiEii/AbiGii toxin family protein [Nitrospira sp.]
MRDLYGDVELFREALIMTQQQYGFPERLIEKDYFCSLVLELLGSAHGDLVFKGGTCLAKVYAEFYRLSEDLDFVIPMPVDASRSEKSVQAKSLKGIISALPEQLPFVRVIEPLTGANNSTQYNAVIGYTSSIGRREETIKIEVGLREPLLLPPLNGEAKTILLDPVSGQALSPTKVRCISQREAFAEKFRAALSRREVAIRDFFDIDYAVRTLGLQPNDEGLVELVQAKLAVPGNEPVNVSLERLAILRQQVDAQLRPVLRERDFQAFDLDRAFRTVANMADRLTERV